jgi:hypothetical protein
MCVTRSECCSVDNVFVEPISNIRIHFLHETHNMIGHPPTDRLHASKNLIVYSLGSFT